MKDYLLLLAVLVLSSFLTLGALADSAPVACPMIAKLCPDGSSVSPQGPNCEIPPCPAGNVKNKSPATDDDGCDDDCDQKKTDEQND